MKLSLAKHRGYESVYDWISSVYVRKKWILILYFTSKTTQQKLKYICIQPSKHHFVITFKLMPAV